MYRRWIHIAALSAALSMPGVALAESDTEQKGVQATVQDAAEKAADYISDAALTARVKTVLTTESALSPFRVSVESTRGVVTLSGDVASEAERKLAERVAADVNGVFAVHNALRVVADAGEGEGE